MEHRKWSQEKGCGLFSAEVNEHNALYDAYKSGEELRIECLNENSRLDRELDEARKRIAELESPLRVPFSDAQIERMAKAAHKDFKNPNWECSPFKESWRSAIRAALAAGGLEPCADVALRPADSDDEVEKLARVLCAAYCAVNKYGKEWESQSSTGRDYYMAEARAAIAHMLKRPEGLPTAEELARGAFAAIRPTDTHWDYQPANETRRWTAIAHHILAELAPYLRDPVGWELDVTAEEIGKELEALCCDVAVFGDAPYNWDDEGAALIQLFVSSIRPTYECKECAHKQTRIHRLEGWVCALEGYCDDMRKLAAQLPARAALEGE